MGKDETRCLPRRECCHRELRAGAKLDSARIRQRVYNLVAGASGRRMENANCRMQIVPVGRSPMRK